jgi:hypothetical protein
MDPHIATGEISGQRPNKATDEQIYGEIKFKDCHYVTNRSANRLIQGACGDKEYRWRETVALGEEVAQT